jgi:hypothetical protein
MSENINDARSALLEAKAEVTAFFEEFMLEYYEPDIILATRLWYDSLPPEEQARIEKEAPDKIAFLKAKTGGQR